MAKQFDNSFVRLANHQTSGGPLTAISFAVGGCLVLGLAMALLLAMWPFALVFGASLLGLIAYSFLSARATRRLAAAQDESRIDWESAMPEVQRESLNIEVGELSRILGVTTEQMSDLQSAYIVAEDLALRQIQQEEQVPLMRHVSIGDVPFDAILVKQDVIYCGEVSFLVAPDLRQERIDAMLRKMARVKVVLEQMNVAMKVMLMIILVTQLTDEDEQRLRKMLNTAKRFPSSPVEIEIRFLDFEALQRIYVTE
ncbi:MAG TPA: hypothetical protein VJV05_13565 [Pyrinomonadaceae bacterium]|nr:hypothetical protein [Pyrinomonadaceae bacterium]